MSFNQPRDATNGPTGLSDRLPPQNLDAERGVLGAILLDNDVLDEVASVLKVDDFYRDAHQAFYRAILRMREDSIAIDAVTVADELSREGVFKKIGGDDLLAEIANSVPHAANAVYHADIVRQKSINRQLIQVSTDIIRDGYSNLFTCQELLEDAEKRIFAIRDKEVSRGTVHIKEAIDEAMAMMARIKEGGEVEWISTGITPLDTILIGMQPGQLIILAGRPGAGKSAMAAQIASCVANNQKTCSLLISLEMQRIEFARRMIAAKAAVNSKLMKNMAPLNDWQIRSIAAAAGDIAGARLQIDDTPGQTIAQISANARRWKRKDNLGFLVVDYLQKVYEPSSRNENRTTAVGRISGALKDLAKELGIPVLALAQLNRNSETEDRPPRMADLYESGKIEQDADVILLLHNKTPKGDVVGPVDLNIAKNRDGEEAIIDLVFHRPTSTFVPAAHPGQVRDAERMDDDHRDSDYDSPDVVPFR